MIIGTLIILSVLFMYLGFFVCFWLGVEHWAFTPTVISFVVLVLTHWFLIIRKIRNEAYKEMVRRTSRKNRRT